MQIFARREGCEYLSNHPCCILHYITDYIGLAPVSILLLPHWLCPDKSFFENTTLGVSHYETARQRLRRRPRPHRSSRLHPHLLRLLPEQRHIRQSQLPPRSYLLSPESKCRRYRHNQAI